MALTKVGALQIPVRASELKKAQSPPTSPFQSQSASSPAPLVPTTATASSYGSGIPTPHRHRIWPGGKASSLCRAPRPNLPLKSKVVHATRESLTKPSPLAEKTGSRRGWGRAPPLLLPASIGRYHRRCRCLGHLGLTRSEGEGGGGRRQRHLYLERWRRE